MNHRTRQGHGIRVSAIILYGSSQVPYIPVASVLASEAAVAHYRSNTKELAPIGSIRRTARTCRRLPRRGNGFTVRNSSKWKSSYPTSIPELLHMIETVDDLTDPVT